MNAKFPEVYTGGEAPAAFGVRDLERKLVTPVYRYGWVVSRTELYEALNGEPCRHDRHLYRLHVGASSRLYDVWKEKGYDNNEYNPNIPCVKEFGPKHVVIYMACNDSDPIIESIMKNKKFHEECRTCMSNPNAMVMEPAWIRVGMRHCPKELCRRQHRMSLIQIIPFLARILNLILYTLCTLLFLVVSYVLISLPL